MKFYKLSVEGKEMWGILEGDFISLVDGDIFNGFIKTGSRVPVKNANILPPLVNHYIVAVGANYLDHIKESSSIMEAPKDPVLFIKLPTSIIGHEGTIVLPEGAGRVDYEAEIAVMVGKDLENADLQEAREAIFGITCLNDVSARDVQQQDGQWIRAKNFKTFTPLGPCVETDMDPDCIKIELKLNGETKQKSNSSHMIFNIPELLSFISKHIPLKKGDIVTTGTPEGIGPLSAGDTVEVVIEGVGVLRNTVSNACC